ncbi:EAL domain-containing protein [Clostridium sp. AM58-1XD]|uniref:EAL domain-containing protein n=1 Tax=Clostridium sp. AM58-1XD TaxID=2292307 RepID=UPI000E4FB424|nr:EAL domain-containing protein [Clostridium sp. AM58-1XD]RGY95923.1 EAL domain-containing protein [Clostridium sp. AM58-1XD]
MAEFIEELDGMNELIYMSDIDTYELLYMNTCGLKQFGLKSRQEISGRKCYDVLQGLDSPCSFCTNSKLNKDEFYEWQTQNPITQHQYLLKDKLITYEGRDVRMEIAMDISKFLSQERQIKILFENEQIAMECARALQDTRDDGQAIGRALEILGKKLKGDRTYIFEIHDRLMDNIYEWCAPAIKAQKEHLQGIPQEVCHHWIEAFEQRRPYIISNLEEHAEIEPAEYERLKPQGIHSLITVPLFEQNQLIGYMGIDNPPYENGSNIIEILQILAYFIQAVLIRMRTNEKLRKKTYMDELTGSRNQNAYLYEVEMLNAQIQLDKQNEENVGMGAVFVDANGLKEINDTIGHEAGDKLLIYIAQKIIQFFPAKCVYRIGGDEFVVLSNHVEENVFLQEAAKLRDSLRENEAGQRDKAAVGACWSRDAVYVEEIVNKAESEMYESKKQYYKKRRRKVRSFSETSDMLDTYTTLLFKDSDVVLEATKLLHLIVEHWNEEQLRTMLDNDFILFEEEYQKVFRGREAIAFLKKQQEGNEGQKLRDMQFFRKRIVRGVSILSCYGQLDGKNKEGKACSIPVDATLMLVQKNGRIKCLYMHSTNIGLHKEHEDYLQRNAEAAYSSMMAEFSDGKNPLVSPENALNSCSILMNAFELLLQKYSNVYFVNIIADFYITLRSENKFYTLVGSSGNFTCINVNYAEQYMDEINKIKYHNFTSRKNLLDNLEKGHRFISMTFFVDKDSDKKGREVEVDIWLGDLSGEAVCIFAFKNITENPKTVEIKETDNLTGLASYEKFRQNGQNLIDQRPGKFAVVSTDFQNFKYINEVLGYKSGDKILKNFAANLMNMQGMHTRVTADHFLTMLTYDQDSNYVIEKVRRNIEQFTMSQKVQSEDIKVVLRMGIYFVEENCTNIDTAIDYANITRQSIGQTVSNEIAVYNEAFVRQKSLQSKILARMESSLENGDFQVWIQPKIDLKTGKLCGAEALSRWMNNGTVCFYPDEFIPIFENNGFITSLDLYVLETVCKNLAQWESVGWKDMVRISINLSVMDIMRDGVVDSIKRIVNRYHVDYKLLEFELTETGYFQNFNTAAYVMKELQNLGFFTSVDDFGSGYSVMNMLVNMSANVIKIDRAFMLNSIRTKAGCTLLERMIGIVHELGYSVLCEGIETQEQLDLLRNMGCDEGQGYLFAKPMPINEYFNRYRKE